MKHLYKAGKNQAKPTLILLHGTGGDEHALLTLADRIDPEASVLSIRGSVLENGMPRFFKRIAEGVFDLSDLEIRTKELRDFLEESAQTYGFSLETCVAVGYSNGANIAASLLFYYGKIIKGAVLHHPMVPRRDLKLPEMAGLPVFIGAGRNDPICPVEETNELSEFLKKQGANVTVHWENDGHQLTMKEVEQAREWYNRVI